MTTSAIRIKISESPKFQHTRARSILSGNDLRFVHLQKVEQPNHLKHFNRQISAHSIAISNYHKCSSKPKYRRRRNSESIVTKIRDTQTSQPSILYRVSSFRNTDLYSRPRSISLPPVQPRNNFAESCKSCPNLVDVIEEKKDQRFLDQYQVIDCDPTRLLQDQTIESELEYGVNEKTYDYLQLVGVGSFGTVFRVRHHHSKEQYAMKIINLREVNDDNDLLEEKDIMVKMDHPFIIRLFHCFKVRNYLCLVMELVTGGNLLELRNRKKKPLREEVVRFHAAEILLALEYMHKNGILYRDLKPDNVMVDKEGHVRLIDLGVALQLNRRNKKGELRKLQKIGGVGYKSPEMMKKKKKGSHLSYGFASDYWNFGILLYLLMSGKHPFYKYFTLKSLDERVMDPSCRVKSVRRISHNANDLMMKLLNKNPSKRLGGGKRGAAEIKEHPFFAGIDWHKVGRKQVTTVRDSMALPLIPTPHIEEPRYKDFEGVIEFMENYIC